jgi:hypothetical protein
MTRSTQKPFLQRTLLALCIGFAASAAQADAYEASFEGNWRDSTQSGRGAMVDYIPQANGNGAYFVAFFTYDQQGAPLWLTIQGQGPEGTRLFNTAEVRSFRGGNFGVPFIAPNPGAGTLIGTAVLDFRSCNSLGINFNAPNASATVPATNFNYTRITNGPAAACPFIEPFTACPTGTTAVANEPRTCEIAAGTLTGNVRLTNNATYFLNGRVQIGDPLALSGALGTAQGTLTIEPGTVIRGRTPRSYLVINGGSRIFAEGSPTAPIIFTGATEVSAQASEGTWGGLIVAGRAPLNSNCVGASTTCRFEADQEIVWGGTLPTDNSGILKYVQIRSAGGIVSPNNDLNALTLGGVGSGTVVEFVQAHNGTDDGFEMFGGTVNLRYIVATGNNDDSLDTDFGYSGNIQYAYVKLDSGSVADSNGIESDNGGQTSNLDALPRTRPTLANATFDGAGFGFDAIKVRRGSGFVLSNVIASNFIGSCINFNDNATYVASAPAGQPLQVTNGGVAITGSTMGCTKNFDDVPADPFLISAFFNGQAGNLVGDVNGGLTRGRFPTVTSALRTGVNAPASPFFQNVTVRGAFVDGDWTAGWTTGL